MTIQRLHRVKSARRGFNCNVRGCPSKASRASGYCAKHDHYQRRNGHPEQETIKHRHLKPTFTWLSKLIRTSGKQDAVKHALTLAMKRLGAEAQAEIAEWQTGKVRHVPTMRAWMIIADVAENTGPLKASLIALSVLLMAHLDPNAFKSQRAVIFSLARRWRALSNADVGVWWDHKENRTKRCRRDISPLVSEIAGQIILDTFKKPAAQILTYVQRLEAEREEAEGAFRFLNEEATPETGARAQRAERCCCRRPRHLIPDPLPNDGMDQDG